MILGFSKFNEGKDSIIDMIEDMCFEYFDKWNITSEDIYNREFHVGYFKILQLSTTYFKFRGFTDSKKNGYLLEIHVNQKFDIKLIDEFKSDMGKYIERVCKNTNFDFDTSFDKTSFNYGFYISFFKKEVEK